MNFMTPVASKAGGNGSTTIISGSAVIAFKGAAAGPLSAGRMVYASDTGLALADKDNLPAQSRVLGLTISSAAAIGEIVEVVGEGGITDPSFTFVPGPLWLGNAGELIQTPPASGLYIQVGTAITATSIYIDIGPAIKLA